MIEAKLGFLSQEGWILSIKHGSYKVGLCSYEKKVFLRYL